MSKTELTRCHIWIDNESIEISKKVAQEYGLTFSHIVRLALADNLDSLAKKKAYRDENQAKEISDTIHNIYTDIDKIKLNLQRIGTNTNQIAKYVNMQKVYEDTKNLLGENSETTAKYADALANMEREMSKLYSKEELSELIDKFQKSTKELCAVLNEFI